MILISLPAFFSKFCMKFFFFFLSAISFRLLSRLKGFWCLTFKLTPIPLEFSMLFPSSFDFSAY